MQYLTTASMTAMVKYLASLCVLIAFLEPVFAIQGGLCMAVNTKWAVNFTIRDRHENGSEVRRILSL